MPKVASDMCVKSFDMRKKENPEEEKKRKNRTAIIFIAKNPTPLFVRQFNAERQAVCELEFSEEKVENPEHRKQQLRGYCV